MIHSIRFKITLWYCLILAVILVAFGSILYLRVSDDLMIEVDELLTVEADAVSDELFAFWKGEIQAAKGIGRGRQTKRESSFIEAVRNQDFSELLTLWNLSTSNFEAGPPTQMLNGAGKVIATSKRFEQWRLPLDQIALSAGQGKKTVYETYKSDSDKIRVILRPIIEDDELVYFVRVGKSLKQEQVMLWRLQRWILWLIPLTLILSSLAGWFLALRALSPVKEMTRKASIISMQKLDERIERPKTNDELDLLAQTFNKMLNRIESSVKGLRRFNAATAHELRTPLTAMKGELELALHKPREREEYKEVVETQLETVDDMIHTVEQLLAVARSGADVALNLKAVDVHKVIEEATDRVKMMASKKNVELKFEHVNTAAVSGDATLLTSVFQNLLENAVKHSPEGSAIAITSDEKKDFLQLKVKDQGKGIAAEELAMLFDKFFTGRHPNAPKDSTGLGLGLCKWIVEAHQGYLDVTSQPGGTTFLVSLPKR